MKFKQSKFLITILISACISCTTEIDYRFKVKNTTNYQLDKIVFGNMDGTIISVKPNMTSDLFIIKRQDNKLAKFFSEPLLGVTVLSYSDSVSTYENQIGEVISISDLKEDEINILTFRLVKQTHHPTHKFTVHDND